MTGFLQNVTIQGMIVGFIIGALLMTAAGTLRPPRK